MGVFLHFKNENKMKKKKEIQIEKYFWSWYIWDLFLLSMRFIHESKKKNKKKKLVSVFFLHNSCQVSKLKRRSNLLVILFSFYSTDVYWYRWNSSPCALTMTLHRQFCFQTASTIHALLASPSYWTSRDLSADLNRWNR